MKEKKIQENFIKFLGTAGARFVMITQLRSSGGVWIRYKSTNIIVDPGPGSLVRCRLSKPKLNPSNLDGIILTHKHLDHSGDVNVMIEAMTDGGFSQRGKLFIPEDALGKEGTILSYLKGFVKEIVILKKGGNFSVGDIYFSTPLKNIHPVLTYGVKFSLGDKIVSLISDTAYFDEIVSAYSGVDILILNVVFYQKRGDYQHLCLDEAIDIVKKAKPKQAIFTHFGMTMLSHKPHKIEENLHKQGFPHIKCAYDGMTVLI